jgi:uroporphyrin-III C-methyltransferase/precorrin-2 dehydrogenase/sirohydrochlorin ferrochelatase
MSGRPCLVVGGGPVAARKLVVLVEAGAVVTVVAPETVAAIDTAASGPGAPVTVERRPYRHGEAAGYALVVAATGDPRVDDRVEDDARGAGVMVNRAGGGRAGADGGGRGGTVQLPAVLRRGPVTVAVGTGGTSPALARWLRDRIAASLPDRLEAVTMLLEEARGKLRAAGRTTDSVDWAALLDRTVLPLVEAGRIDEARTALLRALDTDSARPEREPPVRDPSVR